MSVWKLTPSQLPNNLLSYVDMCLFVAWQSKETWMHPVRRKAAMASRREHVPQASPIVGGPVSHAGAAFHHVLLLQVHTSTNEVEWRHTESSSSSVVYTSRGKEAFGSNKKHR